MARFEGQTGSRTWNRVTGQQARTARAANRFDPIPALFVCMLPDGPLEFGGGSWLTSRKSTRSFEVLYTPHAWRPLRVIACMPRRPWNASLGSIQIGSTKRTGANSFWKRTKPSPPLLGSQPSMERSFYVAQINP
jgi:hypothetical protein